MKMLTLTLAAMVATGTAQAETNPAKARDCRGEMGKMVAMGLIEGAEQTGPTTMEVQLSMPRWKVMPPDMKHAIGRTIGCVLTEGRDLTKTTAVVEFVSGDEKTPVARMDGDSLTMF